MLSFIWNLISNTKNCARCGHACRLCCCGRRGKTCQVLLFLVHNLFKLRLRVRKVITSWSSRLGKARIQFSSAVVVGRQEEKSQRKRLARGVWREQRHQPRMGGVKKEFHLDRVIYPSSCASAMLTGRRVTRRSWWCSKQSWIGRRDEMRGESRSTSGIWKWKKRQEKSSLKLSQRQSQKVVSRISAMAMISFIYMSVDGYPIQCHSRRSQKKWSRAVVPYVADSGW